MKDELARRKKIKLDIYPDAPDAPAAPMVVDAAVAGDAVGKNEDPSPTSVAVGQVDNESLVVIDDGELQFSKESIGTEGEDV